MPVYVAICDMRTLLKYAEKSACKRNMWQSHIRIKLTCLLKVSVPIEYRGSHLYMVPWAHPSPHTKWHRDQFSRFCRTHTRDQQTHTHGPCCMCNSRSHLVPNKPCADSGA